MAAAKIDKVEGKKRKRSVNFSKDEILKLEELVRAEEHFGLLTSKFSTAVTGKKKQETWEHIARELSQLGYATRTATEVTNKWHNLKRESKEAVTERKLQRRKTGGGPEMAVSEQHERVAALYEDTAAFSGIVGGTDSNETDGFHFMANLDSTPHEDIKVSFITDASPSTLSASTSSPQMEASTSSAHMGPSTSSADTEPCSRKVTKPAPKMSRKQINAKRQRVTQEQLAAAQLAYFQGEVRKNVQQEQNLVLQEEKLQLQIRLLRRLEEREKTMTSSDMFAALPFLME